MESQHGSKRVPPLSEVLSPQRALISRITHRDNLPWLLANGLHSARGMQAPNFVSIGNPDLIGKRSARQLPEPPGGSLDDYVPFYFTPRSPMLLNVLTGHKGIQRRGREEIATVVSSIPTLVEQRIAFLFTDRHAYAQTAIFAADPDTLPTMIDWELLCSSDFRRTDDDFGKVERYQAEALVHRHLPIAAVLAIACVSETSQRQVGALVRDADLSVKVISRPDWYF